MFRHLRFTESGKAGAKRRGEAGLCCGISLVQHSNSCAFSGSHEEGELEVRGVATVLKLTV